MRSSAISSSASRLEPSARHGGSAPEPPAARPSCSGWRAAAVSRWSQGSSRWSSSRAPAPGRRATTAARVALARQLGAQAVNEPRLDLAMLLAREAVNLDRSPQTEGSLLATLQRSPAVIGTLTLPINAPQQLAVSPDGRTLAVGALSLDQFEYRRCRRERWQPALLRRAHAARESTAADGFRRSASTGVLQRRIAARVPHARSPAAVDRGARRPHAHARAQAGV